MLDYLLALAAFERWLACVFKFKLKTNPTSSLDYYYTIKEKSDVERLIQSGIDFMKWNLDNRGKDIENWISQYVVDLFRIKY